MELFKRKKLNKKGFTIAQIPSLAIAFVIISIVLSLGSTIVSSNQATQTANSYAYNASENGLLALDTFSSWQNTLALVAVVVVVLGVVMLLGRQMKG